MVKLLASRIMVFLFFERSLQITIATMSFTSVTQTYFKITVSLKLESQNSQNDVVKGKDPAWK